MMKKKATVKKTTKKPTCSERDLVRARAVFIEFLNRHETPEDDAESLAVGLCDKVTDPQELSRALNAGALTSDPAIKAALSAHARRMVANFLYAVELIAY